MVLEQEQQLIQLLVLQDQVDVYHILLVVVEAHLMLHLLQFLVSLEAVLELVLIKTELLEQQILEVGQVVVVQILHTVLFLEQQEDLV